MRYLHYISVVFLFSVISYGQEVPWLHPNKGQWHSNVAYKVELNAGAMFIEDDGITYHFNNYGELYEAAHGHDHAKHEHHELEEKHHVVKTKFLGSSWKGKRTEKEFSSFYRNYILGSDSTKWKGEIYSIREVILHDFYEGIDLKYEATPEAIKYSFLCKPNADISQIRIKYDGQDKLYLDKNKNLHSTTIFGDIIELEPISFSYHKRKQKRHTTNYVINNAVVTFNIENRNAKDSLVIDPEITFSTFTGSSANNWGFTATPDKNANLFGGGIVASSGYPATSGAFDATFNGGDNISTPWDVGISKFNSEGNSLLFSTYLGGTGNETPHSIISDAQGNLFILGVTSSNNFPLAGNIFQNSHNGGPSVNENGIAFSQTDLYLAKLSANGSNLLAATYFGGSSTDGINLGTLAYNYGDQFRGEITLDEDENVYFSSTTRSTNFPTQGALSDNTLGGTQDAVAGKFNSDLSNLFWSTYIGGSGQETGNALQLSSTGDAYVTGGTTSGNFTFNTGLDLTFNAGQSDAYVIRLDGNNAGTLSGTYIGTNEYDQGYFVQLDLDDNVYIFGQTEGYMPISPGIYGTPNSGQFIKKFNAALTAEDWSTTIGAGSGHVEISPTAFLVSNCYEIYLAGWGGTLNSGFGAQADFSTTNGFSVTPDAFQSSTNGNNFYLAVLKENATSLGYATFMGGVIGSNNHVDGGTSRFDKQGRIYHAVCGSCGSTSTGFTTTTGAFSNTDNSSQAGCNMAVFKFELSQIIPSAASPEPLICIPDPVIFENNSENANTFQWSFGDGGVSNAFEPSHNYTSPGTYNVTLIVSDSNECFAADTIYFNVVIGIFEGAIVDPPPAICPGEPFQLEASGGSTYQWTPAEFLDNPSIANPTATIQDPTLFSVIVTDDCGIDTLTAFLDLYGQDVDATNDTSICFGEILPVWATGGSTYAWSPPEGLDNTNLANTNASPDATTTYNVLITTAEGCEIEEEFTITVFYDPPVPDIIDTTKLCKGFIADITANGAEYYDWSPPTGLNTTEGAIVTTNVTEDITYYIDFTNACGTIPDSTVVDVIEVDAFAGNDTIVCPGYTANIFATGGVSYSWSPNIAIANSNAQYTSVSPETPLWYTVLVTDEYGCQASDSVRIEHYPIPFVVAGPDFYGFSGDEVQLSADSYLPGGSYSWSPNVDLSCTECQNPISTITTNYTYIVTYEDKNGCIDTDSLHVNFDAIIYVPNTFTPDGIGANNLFKVEGGNVVEFSMLIFNRWGELIHELTHFDDTWDGTYKGTPVQDGTYIWKIDYKDINGVEGELNGHINVLR